MIVTLNVHKNLPKATWDAKIVELFLEPLEMQCQCSKIANSFCSSSTLISTPSDMCALGNAIPLYPSSRRRCRDHRLSTTIREIYSLQNEKS